MTSVQTGNATTQRISHQQQQQPPPKMTRSKRWCTLLVAIITTALFHKAARNKAIKEFITACILGGSLISFAVSLNILQVLSLFTLPLTGRKTNINFNSSLAGIAWYLLQYVFERYRGARIRVTGDELPNNENAFVISNHIAASDFLLINAISMRKGMMQHCKYFLKESIKLLPGYGWGMWLMGMIFISRDFSTDAAKITKSFDSLISLKVPVWLISYLEGTRISDTKIEESQAFASSRQNIPMLKNVLVPRTKGFVAVMKGLRAQSHITHLYDFTLSYHRIEDNSNMDERSRPVNLYAPTLYRILKSSLAEKYVFHIHVRRFPIASLPTDDAALIEWVMNLWKEKDQKIEELTEYYRRGEVEEPKEVAKKSEGKMWIEASIDAERGVKDWFSFDGVRKVLEGFVYS